MPVRTLGGASTHNKAAQGRAERPEAEPEGAGGVDHLR